MLNSCDNGVQKIGAPIRRNQAGRPSSPVAVGRSVCSSLNIRHSVRYSVSYAWTVCFSGLSSGDAKLCRHHRLVIKV